MVICDYIFCDLPVLIRVSTHGGRQFKYCGLEHKKLAHNNRRKTKRRIWHTIECKGCSVKFSTYFGTVEYCEDKCRIRHLRKQESYRILSRARNHRFYNKNKDLLNQVRSVRHKLLCECGNKKLNIDDVECNNCLELNNKVLS